MIDLPERLRQFLRVHDLRGTLLCGFSGGADSTALLLALHLAGADVSAVHFHHGLRGTDADADADWCRTFCVTRAIPLQTVHLDVPHSRHPGESTEEAARRLRLEQWVLLSPNGTLPVLLAHHADDAIEELFLRLARGSNASGLTPLHLKRILHGIPFFRPLLPFRKQELIDWLASQGITDFRHDSTNDDNSIRRNAVRNLLLPLYRQIFGQDSSLLLSLQHLADDAACLDALAPAQPPRELAAWRSLPPALFVRTAHLWLQQNGYHTPLRGTFLARLQQQIQSFSGKETLVPLNDSTAIAISSDGLRLHCPETPAFAPFAWNWREQPCVRAGNYLLTAGEPPSDAIAVERFSLAEMPPVLEIRTWQHGDRMRPFGSEHEIKLQDLFTNAKLPKHLRSTIPILLANQQIIWLPTVRRANFAPLLPGQPSLTLAASIVLNDFHRSMK
ncbi:MAG: tRNA lysidine(34) synthetase TilS [Victivallales bacterium]|nr:tRNA lysidine(34) synthetase TilS [Victivallales bacterium]